MKRRQFLQTGLGLSGLSLVSAEVHANTLHWQNITFTGLGTVLSIRAAHESRDALEQALQRARQVVACIEDEMSLFRPDSALSRLNAVGFLSRPPKHLLNVLRMSQHVAHHSAGAFDVTVQPLWNLYANAQKDGQLPSAHEVMQARAKVDWQRLHVSDTQIDFSTRDMGVTLNGIAQGYAADAVRASLQHDGVQHALINTGEWSSIGQAEGERPWTLGIANPHRAEQWLTRMTMNGLSVATSADDQCAFSSDRRHHHIFNPHTGYSPQDIASITVAAATCAMADALTKVIFVAGYDHALAIAKTWKVAALVVHKNGAWKASSNFPLARS